MVEGLARALAARNDVALSFCAARSWDAAANGPRFLASSEELRAPPFVARPLALHTVGALARMLPELEQREPRAPALRRVRRGFRRTVAVLNRALPPVRDRDLRRCDVFHAPAYCLPDRSATRAHGNYLLTIHDLLPIVHPQFFLPVHRAAVRRLVRSIRPGDRLLCVSRATAQDVCNVVPAIDAELVTVTSPAADRALFHPVTDPEELRRVRSRYGIPADTHYVLSVNTREPRKNIDSAVRAFNCVVEDQQLSDLSFVLVGGRGWLDGELDGLLSRRARARGKLSVTGYVPDRDLAALYSGSMFFVYPSFCEGFGLPVLEAMQCRAPVITSSSSSLPEVAGDAAITVDPHDIDALSEAMLRLYRSRRDREALAYAGARRAATFSWQRCAGETVRSYREALA